LRARHPELFALPFDLMIYYEVFNLPVLVKKHQDDGFDVGASCGRPCPGERSLPLRCKARKT
jgi:hypothetical protein